MASNQQNPEPKKRGKFHPTDLLAAIAAGGFLSVFTVAAVVFGGAIFILLLWAGISILAHLPWWFWLILIVGAGGGLLVHFVVPDPPPPPPPAPPERPSGAFGDGGFAYGHEILARDVLAARVFSETGQWDYDNDPGRCARGIYLQNFIGMYGNEQGQDWCPMTYRGEAHAVTLAPTRSGKGTGAVIPTLLMTSESVFVLDVKGENWSVTHKNREQNGYKVRLLNPFNKWGAELGSESGTHTAQFNPLARLDPNQPDFVDVVRGLAAALIVSESKENKHFSDRARDLVACLIAHVATDPKEKSKGRNNLPRVRQLLGLEIRLFAAYMMQAASSPVPMVQNIAPSFAPEKPEDAREVISIISTANGQLGFLDNPQVMHFLSGDDFDFAELRQPKTAVYFIIGAEQLHIYQTFVRLMVQGCLNALWKSPAPGESSVLLVLDEIYQLGELESLKKAYSMMAGFDVRIWSIFQDLGQMKEVYGAAWETVLSGAGFVQLLGVNDMTTAEYFSKKIGKSTLVLQEVSGGTSTGVGSDGKPHSSTTQNWSEKTQAIDAVSPQKLMQLGKWGTGLVFVRDEPHPAMTTNRPYYAPNFALPYPVGVPQGVLPNAARREDYERAMTAMRAWQAEKAARLAEEMPLPLGLQP